MWYVADMPELPEVETVVRGLRAEVCGRRFVAVRLGKTDFMDDPAAIQRELPGRQIERVERYGKFLVMRLGPANGAGSAASLLLHLCMTGQISPRRPEETAPLHTHAYLSLDDGRELRYTDVRRFGRMAFLAEGQLEAELGRLGLDPFETGREKFCAHLSGRQAMIKALLLDQHTLRGLGNIYADESLWRARIHPRRQAARLSREQLARLHAALQHVLKAAIKLRGSSISDFVDAEGRPGEYQQRHRAYGREGKDCYRCGSKIRRVIVAGRSSYFCPRCQREPAAWACSAGRKRGAAAAKMSSPQTRRSRRSSQRTRSRKQ